MKNKRITKRAVDALQCPSGRDRTFLWDDEVSGFGVAAFASGTKVYVAQYRQNGRSRRIAIGEHGRLTPDQARSRAKEILGAVEGGADPIGQRRAARAVRTFREVADEFMRVHVGNKRKPATANQYSRLLASHINPAIGARRINDIRRRDVSQLHAKLADLPYAANRCMSVISAVWNWAAKRDEVAFADNPARGIERNPENRKERYLTTDELSRLGDALRTAETVGLPWDVDENSLKAKHVPKENRVRKIDPYAVAAIRLLTLTGARFREILTARWDYVDIERGLINLPDSKTGRKTLYLSAAALSVLNGIPRQTANPYIIAGQPTRTRRTAKNSGAANPEMKAARQTGRPRADLKNPWAAISKAAGLTGVRIHDLRHSFASIGAGASLGLPVIGKLLGHSNTVTTQRYAHLDADPLKRAAETIGGQIAAAMEGRKGEVVPLRREASGN